MGDVYYYTALPRGDEGRGAERKRQNIPFPLPLLLPIQKPHRGWRALSPEEGGEGGLHRNAASSWGGINTVRGRELDLQAPHGEM